MSKPGADFEDYVHYIYSTLLNMKGEHVRVSKRTTFRLPSNESYEIDVFYEFTRVGVTHRVAIECKDWASPVDQGKVLEFHQKIKNIGDNVVGVFISRSGYQSGAESVAKRHGILLLTASDVPTIPNMLAQHITTSFIPEDNCIGEPFWYIAELDKPGGEPTGTYYAFPDGSGVNIPLFISREYAQAFHATLPDKASFKVYGMAQHKLRGLLAFAIHQNLVFGIVLDYPMTGGLLKLRRIEALRLKNDFLLLEFPKNLEQ